MTESFIAFSQRRYHIDCILNHTRTVGQSERQVMLQEMVVQLRDINAALDRITANLKAQRLSAGVNP